MDVIMNETLNIFLVGGGAILALMVSGVGALVYFHKKHTHTNISARADDGSEVNQTISITDS